MTTTGAAPASVRLPAGRTWRGIPVVLPNRRDPRLHVSAVILSLQVLGQVALDFRVSIAQILVTIGVCAAVEVAITYRQQRALVWPASALLTGNGVAFILRSSGTQHGDWWTLQGIEWFLLAALIGLLSKYVVQVGGRHVFNPSNLGLVAVLLVVGSPRVFPQYLFWGDLTAPVIAALAILIVGVVFILRPLRMLPMATAFLVPFALIIAVLAASGQCMNAIWHTGPICGLEYWTYISTSPELLVYVFYMMSDPKTAPRLPRARVVYGLTTALLAGTMIAFQPTEYGVKVALLAALVMVCTLVPVLDRVAAALPAGSTPPAAPPRLAAFVAALRPNARDGLLQPSVVALALILVTVPMGVGALAGDERLLDLERGISTNGVPATQ